MLSFPFSWPHRTDGSGNASSLPHRARGSDPGAPGQPGLGRHQAASPTVHSVRRTAGASSLSRPGPDLRPNEKHQAPWTEQVALGELSPASPLQRKHGLKAVGLQMLPSCLEADFPLPAGSLHPDVAAKKGTGHPQDWSMDGEMAQSPRPNVAASSPTTVQKSPTDTAQRTADPRKKTLGDRSAHSFVQEDPRQPVDQHPLRGHEPGGLCLNRDLPTPTGA